MGFPRERSRGSVDFVIAVRHPHERQESPKKGGSFVVEWVFALADARGQWCVSMSEPWFLAFGRDGVARLAYGAPQSLVLTVPAEVGPAHIEFHPILQTQTLAYVGLAVGRELELQADRQFHVDIGNSRYSGMYGFQLRAPGRELRTGVARRSGKGEISLRPSRSDVWGLAGSALRGGRLVAICDQGEKQQAEECRIRVQPGTSAAVPTTSEGDHRYDLFWLDGDRCVPLALRRIASDSTHNVDLDGVRDVLFRSEAPPGSEQDLLILAGDAEFATLLDGRNVGMLVLPVGADGVACASLLPGEYFAIRGYGVKRFRVGTEQEAAPVTVPRVDPADVGVTIKGRVAGTHVKDGYTIQVEAQPLGELTTEQQIEACMTNLFAMLERPGEFELRLPKSIARWRLVATAAVPDSKLGAVDCAGSCEVALASGETVQLRLAPAKPEKSK